MKNLIGKIFWVIGQVVFFCIIVLGGCIAGEILFDTALGIERIGGGIGALVGFIIWRILFLVLFGMHAVIFLSKSGEEADAKVLGNYFTRFGARRCAKLACRTVESFYERNEVPVKAGSEQSIGKNLIAIDFPGTETMVWIFRNRSLL